MTIDLDAIMARRALATRGPWESFLANTPKGEAVIVRRVGSYFDIVADCGGMGPSRTAEKDGDFIAHAHEDVGLLVDEVRRLQEVIAEQARQYAERDEEDRTEWRNARERWKKELDGKDFSG
jgi:hypothetical protein